MNQEHSHSSTQE